VATFVMANTTVFQSITRFQWRETAGFMHTSGADISGNKSSG
jgi:hypothetical protein